TPKDEDGTPRAAIEIDPRRQQLIGVRTAKAERQSMTEALRTVGVVRYDETRQVDVNVKVEGWIRELMVNYTGHPVKKAQLLFTLSSPQLLGGENEYLLTLKSPEQMKHSQMAETRERTDQLVAAARQRLMLWDLSVDDLAELDRDRRPHPAIAFHSPIDGFV